MSHMVIYRGSDGSPGYHQTDDVHDAVSFVEKLRNDEGVEHARIFRLEEMNFEYRPYYRVELRAGDAALAAPAAAAAPAVAAAPVVEEAAPEPEPVVEAAAEVVEVAEEAAPEPAPIVTAPETPSVTVNAPEADNGVGARRGLFGR